MRRTMRAAGPLVLALAIAACSDDGGGGPTEPEPGTPRAPVAHLDVRDTAFLFVGEPVLALLDGALIGATDADGNAVDSVELVLVSSTASTDAPGVGQAVVGDLDGDATATIHYAVHRNVAGTYAYETRCTDGVLSSDGDSLVALGTVRLSYHLAHSGYFPKRLLVWETLESQVTAYDGGTADTSAQLPRNPTEAWQLPSAGVVPEWTGRDTMFVSPAGDTLAGDYSLCGDAYRDGDPLVLIRLN